MPSYCCLIVIPICDEVHRRGGGAAEAEDGLS